MSQMHNEQSRFDPNDPRLTAYVLDELSTDERIAVERLLAASPEARMAVAEIRETVMELQSAFDAEPIAPLDELIPSDTARRRNSAVIRSPGFSNSASRSGLSVTTGPRQPVSRRAKLLLTGTVAAALVMTVVLVREQGAPSANSTLIATNAVLDDEREYAALVAQQIHGLDVDSLAQPEFQSTTTMLGRSGGNSANGVGSESLYENQARLHLRRLTDEKQRLSEQLARSTNLPSPQLADLSNRSRQFSLGATVTVSDGAALRSPESVPVPSVNGVAEGYHLSAGPHAVVVGNNGANAAAMPTPRSKEPGLAGVTVLSSSAGLLPQQSFHYDPSVRQEISGFAILGGTQAGPNLTTPERYGKQPTVDSYLGMNFTDVAVGQNLIFNGSASGVPIGMDGLLNPGTAGGLSVAIEHITLPPGLQQESARTENGYVLHDHLQFLPAEQSGQANSAGKSPADILRRNAEFSKRVGKQESLTNRENLALWGEIKDLNSDGVVTEQEQLAQVRSPEVQPRWYFNARPDLPQQNTEAYEPIVENEFLSPRVAPLSTFGVDVDTASYSNVRRFLTQGQLPPPNAVRIEELLNYFKYNDPAPQSGKSFSVNMETAACPWNPEHKLVRIGLKGKEIPHNERPASNLVYLIDVSGSMKEDNKLPLVKSGLELLVNEMADNDRVAIVTYAGHAGVALESTPGNERQKILNVIRGLNADGSTNGEAGLQLAYEQAVKHLIANGTNRVILCTDGDFNVGVSDDDQLVKIIGRHAKSGVYLSIFGFGMGNLKDAKLEKLADKGNGHYGYVDGIREAQKVFVEEMIGTLYTIAKDVKVQVEFNPAKVGAYRLIGYENRIMPAQDFHNDAKDAGDIGAGHSVTALYEIVPPGQPLPRKGLKYQPTAEVKEAPKPQNNSPELLTLSLRYKRSEVITPARIAGDGVFQRSVQEDYPLAEPTDGSAKTSDDFRWSAAVAAFGMILRDSPNRGLANLRMVHELATSSIGGWGGPQDDNYQTAEHVRRNEFLELVKIAGKLSGVIAVDDNQNNGMERKTEEGAANLTQPSAPETKAEFDIRRTSADFALQHTAVNKGMSEKDARRVLAGEGFQLDPDQKGVKQGWLRFRKPWSVGGHHYVTLRIDKEQVVEFDEIWNDP